MSSKNGIANVRLENLLIVDRDCITDGIMDQINEIYVKKYKQ